MVFTIDGVDILPYIKNQGLKWQRSDQDSEKSGRTTLDGTMHRARIASKIRLDVTCKPLTSAQTRIVLNAIFPEFVTVTYDDPQYGRVTKVMYSNNNPATYLLKKPDGTEYWDGITFPLIEK